MDCVTHSIQKLTVNNLSSMTASASTRPAQPPRIGVMHPGHLNAISDVPGVRVGHCTLSQGDIQTGVTVIRAHQQSHFLHKVPAAAVVINGFGKSVGLMQLEELGVLETPIALTNTFSVPAVAQAQLKQAIGLHPEIGRTWPTVNPLVFECNDGYLNDIQAFAVQTAHYEQAHDTASSHFEQGAVGAGRGMSCFELKGGIGSASRQVQIGERSFTLGALVLANFGKRGQLTLDGQRVDPVLHPPTSAPEQGSIIMILATDAPLDARQLRRLATRASVGLARTGSNLGHGSGDIALAFSTAYTCPHDRAADMPSMQMVHEQNMDGLFQAVAESIEQSIVHALWHAESLAGREGHTRQALLDAYPALRK
jgi:D-aminopeptidase